MLFSNKCEYSDGSVLVDDELCISEQYENNLSKHILFGAKLRKLKSKTYTEIKEYHDIDIMPYKDQHHVANYSNSKNKRHESKPRKIRGHKKICPLRVIELAYPSKRHCFETWKTRNKTLSIYMIDRLRKIINDEVPKTPVRDALHFFERSKTKRRKRNVKAFNSNKKREQLKLISCYFGYKIIDILEKPMHIELSSDLARIANIVEKDVSGMLYNSEYQSSSEDEKKIQNDIIKKITVWIDGILEESSHKLFLEELREIEEEEGPVLDLLNEVFNKASSYEPSYPPIKYSTEHIEKYDENGPIFIIPQQLNDEEFEDSFIDKHLKFSEDQYPYRDIESKKYSRPVDRELVEEIFFNALDQVLCDNKNKVNDENSTLESTDLKNIDLKHIKEYINFILIQIIEEACEKYLDKINKNSQPKTVDTANDKDITNNSDDSDVEFEKFKSTKDSLVIRSALDLVSKSEINLDNTVNLSGDESPDEGNKKVKFNNNDIDNMELAKAKESHINNSENHLPILKTRSVTIHNDKTSKTIYLSNPSPYLLYEADESWPESTSFHNTRSLVKVSKSVVSLGDLLEREEDILPQSVKSSIEILNYLLSNNNEIVNENNVSISNNKNYIDKKPNHEKVNTTEIMKDTSKNIFNETFKINSREIITPLTENKDDVTYEEENYKSLFIIPDKDLTFMKTSNQKQNLLAIKKLSNIDIIDREVCSEESMNVRVKTSKHKQHSHKLSNKCIQTKIETLNYFEKTTPERGLNKIEKTRFEESSERLYNIVEHLESWLYWIRKITADVENLLNKESGVKWCKLNNNTELDLTSWISQSRDLQKRLVLLKCKYNNNNLKVMPYKCFCNKNIHGK